MSERLRPIALSELVLVDGGRSWSVHQAIAGLDSLTPVQGRLHAQHHGTALEVTGEAETILTLCCDRCLQHYNHALSARVHELVELRGHEAAAENGTINLELAKAGVPDGDDLDDRLDPAGDFDPERWLFEQLSLRLPLVNRCGDDCPGPAVWSSEPDGIDPRWAALASLGASASGPTSANSQASPSAANHTSGEAAASPDTNLAAQGRTKAASSGTPEAGPASNTDQA